MSRLTPDDPASLAARAAAVIYQSYQDYQAEFHAITRRAKTRFESCDWPGGHADAVERLELYQKIIARLVDSIRQLLGEQVKERPLWTAMRSEYSLQIACCTDYLLAETFFNSLTRRIFATVGVDPQIEYVDSDFDLRIAAEEQVFEVYPLVDQTLDAALGAILQDHPFGCGYQAAARDAGLTGAAIQTHLRQRTAAPIQHIEMLRPAFYRNFGAYIVGRIALAGQQFVPLMLCLRNHGQGVFIDAVLLDEDEISIVFSFTRSYFHVDVEYPHQVVAFLKSILPFKRTAELYIAIGYNKHGKTELYRDLLRHLANSTDQFHIARGEKGMVMAVFTLPSYDMVFKIIKDRIDPPKTTTRAEVRQRYEMVFKHDKAGRLVDAQEFEHLTFDRRRFSEALLAELAAVAPNTVTIHDDTVDIAHLYTERRLTPLNLYVKEASQQAARLAVIDYGQAIKDLAATDIFPGDVLLKNFGVTRHGRVVFYDYDELCRVTECKFRKMPPPRSYDDELAAEPFFYVGPLDIFPEEFRTFLGLQEPLRSLFIEHHGDLFGVDFWRQMQARHRAGEIFDMISYSQQRKLRAS